MKIVLIREFHHRYNEPKRLAERYLWFDPNELCRVKGESIGQSADNIKMFTKLAKGGFYRVFQATFRDGQQVIARLPYPCTIPRTYGVASEEATVEYLRLRGIPIPKILDWSSTSANPVGSEYIIMEMATGRELENTWYSMEYSREWT